MALLYATLLDVIVMLTSLPATVATIGTIMVVGPITYLSHRYYTFRSENGVGFEVAGYAATVALNFPLGAIIVFLSVDLGGIRPFIGGLMAAAFPPMINYVIHTRIVFKSRGTKQ
jgi:putative flippase GtrA